MTSVDLGHGAATDTESSGIGRWLDHHAAAMLLAGATGAALGIALPVVLAAAVSFAFLWRRHGPQGAKSPPLGGYANALTALRLVLILVAAAVMARVPPWVVFLAFAANVALDVVDGHVARRTGQVTAFGSVLDRETDGLFVLAAYEYFFLTQTVGAWVLLPGLMPYLYRLLVRLLGAPMSEERQPLAAALAGVNFGILLAAVAAPPRIALALLAASSAAVALSFAASSWKLYRDEHSVSESGAA